MYYFYQNKTIIYNEQTAKVLLDPEDKKLQNYYNIAVVNVLYLLTKKRVPAVPLTPSYFLLTIVTNKDRIWRTTLPIMF